MKLNKEIQEAKKISQTYSTKGEYLELGTIHFRQPFIFFLTEPSHKNSNSLHSLFVVIMASIVEIAPLLESLSLEGGNTSSLASQITAEPKLLAPLAAHR